MSSLLYFILGIITAGCILPILDSLTSVIVSLLEIPKGKAALKISKYNNEIKNLEQKDSHVQQIGFVIPDENCEEEIEYE